MMDPDEYQSWFNTLTEICGEVEDMFPYNQRFHIISFRKRLHEHNGISNADLEFLVYTFLSQGNNISRIIQTSSGETKTRLEMLRDKLNIVERAGNHNRTVTLSRIASSLPDTVAKILSRDQNNLSGVISLDEVRAVSKQADYPSLSRHDSLTSFIPKHHQMAKDILNVFLLPNILFSERINKRKAGWNNSGADGKIYTTKRFLMKGHLSNLFREDERVKLCEEFGIMKDGEFTSPWVAAATSAKAALIAAYGDSF